MNDDTPLMALLRNLFTIVMLLVVWISLRPFASSPGNLEGIEAEGGDIVNQIGFGMLGIIAILGLFALASPSTLPKLFRPAHLGVLAVMVFSVTVAPNPDEAFRTMMFSLIVILAAAASLALPRSPQQLAGIFAVAVLLALAFSYFAVFFVPGQGLHGAGGDEPQHAGLWRGIYDHKNIASAVMGVFAMFGIFIFRRSYRLVGLIIIALSIIFIINAGSKTVLALVPAAFVLTTLAGRARSNVAKYFLCLVPLFVLLTITVGSATSSNVNAILQSIAPGTTFTGRLDLWQFASDRIMERPMTGYGYESFWGTPLVEHLEQPIELSWDVRGIVHAHNAYLDTAINFGLPGAAIMFFVIIILPVRDFVKAPHSGIPGQIANLFLMIWMFCAMDASLESFFFRRADPVWFGMLLSIFGLRLLAAMNKEAQEEPAPSGLIKAAS